MCETASNNELYAAITREIIQEIGGSCDHTDEFKVGEIGSLPHHLTLWTPVLIEAETDLTVHFWQDAARVVIYRDWKADTALVESIGYGPNFGETLNALVQRVEETLRVMPDKRAAIETLVAE